MQTLPISAVKARLNDLVEQAVRTHEHLTITKNGAPAAVMVSADEWESLQETLFWLSQPGVNEDIAEADRALAAGETISAEDLRGRYGLDRR